MRADRRDLASNRVLRTRGWRPLPEAPGSLIHLSRVPLLTGLVAAPPRTPQRNRNELGETTVNKTGQKHPPQQKNQQLRRCSLRSGRRGRRFESCHSDHCSCHSFYWLFLIAGGSRVNRRFLIRNGHKPAFSRRDAPEACPSLVPSGGGSRECRVHAAPAVSCAIAQSKCAHEHTGTAEALRHSLRSGFTAYAALSPETNSSCLRHCRLAD